MIKVVHVKSRYGPIGGVESMLEGLMPELVRTGEVAPTLVFVTALDDPDMECKLTAGGLIPMTVIKWRGLWHAPLAAWRMARILRNADAEIVHTHDMRADLLAFLLRPFLRIRWLCHIHGWLGFTHKGVHRLYEAVDKFLIRFADHVVVGSWSALDEVRAAGAGASSVAWNAVPLPQPSEIARDSLGLRNDAVVFTILGRLHYGKGQDVFLEALSGLAADARWQAVIVGTGEAEGDLKRQAQALGIADRVIFTGFVGDIIPWIAVSDVVVVASRKESLPLTCLEGMAHAKAMIVTETGDLPRVVKNGVSGVTVPVDDVSAMRRAMLSMLDRPDLRVDFGKKAKEHFLSNHTAQSLAVTLVSRYRALTSGAPASRDTRVTAAR